jgi:imidazolonepropionase-like amidohydrolase
MSAQQDIYALRGVKLIDGTGAAPVHHATVVIDGDQIVAAGPSSSVRLPSDVVATDLPGKTVMPGLIDGHVHLRAYAGQGLRDVHMWNVVTFIEEQTLHCAANARIALESGVTTVRDMAGARPEIATKHAIDDGVLSGARVVASGLVGMTAGHADMFFPANMSERMWRPADGPDACRGLVRQYARDGADFIKVCTSGGVLSIGDKSEWRNYTSDELEAIVDEAHGLGMVVAAHAHSRDGIRAALEAGVDTLEHGSCLDEELIEMMLRSDTWLCPTLAITQFLLDEGDARGVPPASLAKAREIAALHRESMRVAYRYGVRIFMGTDSCNTMAFGRHAWELELMQREIGMTPMETIVASTRSAAEALGVDSITGTVTTGKRADLLVIDGDPLSDLTILQDRSRVLAVIKDGRFEIARGCLTAQWRESS